MLARWVYAFVPLPTNSFTTLELQNLEQARKISQSPDSEVLWLWNGGSGEEEVTSFSRKNTFVKGFVNHKKLFRRHLKNSLHSFLFLRDNIRKVFGNVFYSGTFCWRHFNWSYLDWPIFSDHLFLAMFFKFCNFFCKKTGLRLNFPNPLLCQNTKHAFSYFLSSNPLR